MTTQGEEASVKEPSARNIQHKPKRDNKLCNRDRYDSKQTDRTQREAMYTQQEVAYVGAGMNYDYMFC